MATRLFVYGTLMRCEPNAGWLGHARFLGVARTAPAYALVDLGPYPGLLPGAAGVVEGELYEVDAPTLARLDELEEHPTVYRRAPIALGDGSTAHAYLLVDPRGRPIASGDWRRR